MARFVNAISIIVLSFLGVVSGQVEVAKDDNIEPFALLCRIYNVAKNPPINYVDLHEPVQIVQEIDVLNRSLLEEEGLNEKEVAGNNSEAQVKPTVTREAALTQLSLIQITQKAHTIWEEIKKIKVTETIEKAKTEFHKVIFGEDGNESNLCHATVNDMDNRSKACGPPGLTSKGESAGKNLVVDFFCLCAQRTENKEGVNHVCGFYVGRIDSHYGWGEQGPWGSSTMWASIKGGCGKHMHQHHKSTAEARHILEQFFMHLKTGGVYRKIQCDTPQSSCKNAMVEGSGWKEGMLGTFITVNNTTDVACGGNEGGKKGGNVTPGGVCVYYGQESGWQNIPWVKQFQTALETVDAANNKTASIQRSLQKQHMLLHRAEEIYETAKVIAEIQKPVVPTAFQNASGNLTAFNTTRTRSYSHIPRQYFALPWFLLIL
ncbi:Variant surface glycoprotein [Trypanosoma congolense IL3000]|uniref:Variant surface glycoprotein n=1 Tax=Trypanosoma congolense (strain IL3000) TaxID=1068625 RepID=F9W8K3_TRYCI|nr:Variant surface glycoprotein [Trypanosoma congolense IL3000]